MIILMLAISHLIFSETLTRNNIIGATLIIAGLITLSLQKQHHDTAS